MSNKGNLTIENARIIFRNFSGKEGRFNPPGKRNFCLVIDDPELVNRLCDDGWNVRYLKSRNEGEDDVAYIQIAIAFDNFPPKIVLITGNGKTVLDENTISCLDVAEIENVDLIIRPYHWEVGGKEGVKGYVKSMWVTIYEDELEKKYYEVEDTGEELPF